MENKLKEYIDFLRIAEVIKPKSLGGIFINPEADFQCIGSEKILKPGRLVKLNEK